jgi:beta-fructofuranosidase
MFKPKDNDFRDFDIIPFEGKLWAIHIQSGPVKDSNEFGLASSHDGYEWQEEGIVMKPSENGWDCKSLWAMHLTTDTNGFVLYYSALGKGMRLHQSIGVAHSKDLKTWDRSDKPILSLSAYNEFYDNRTEIGTQELGTLFRDPWSFEYGGKKYLIFAARDKSIDGIHNACIGLAEIREDGSVTYLPPIYSPKKYQELECPALYLIEGKWFLVFCEDIVVQMRYAVSDNPFNGFEEPDDNILASPGNYVGRIVKWNEQHLFFYHTPEHELADPKVIEMKNGKIVFKNDLV